MSTQEKVSDEKIKKLADFRQRLEKRVEEVTAELEELLVLLEFADATLVEKGFRRAEPKQPAIQETMLPLNTAEFSTKVVIPSIVERETTIPLRSETGELLANAHIGEGSLRVILAEDKEFNVNTPPFLQFLVERVLAKMEDKDRRAAALGELEPDKMFSFKIVQDGGIVKEISIENTSEERTRELKSTIRWTLEKMFEKPKSPDA